MGNDEFSTQYQQEPIASEAGYFEKVYFKTIPAFECSAQNLYIFVDNAISLNTAADNRAIVLVGVESYKDSMRYVVRDCIYGIWSEEQTIANDNAISLNTAADNRAIVLVGVESYKDSMRYVVRDCIYGIWSEEQTIANLLDMMSQNPQAKVYIESDGGGLTLERLLQNELVKTNNELKSQDKPPITNDIKCYTPSRKISKVEKIKALRPYYNTGYLVFLHNARGLAQIQKELFSFNPEKPFRKDDCIDAIASACAHSEIVAPPRVSVKVRESGRRGSGGARTFWRI